MTLIYILIILDIAIFAGLYFGYVRNYVLNGQVFMSAGIILGLGLVNYIIYNYYGKPIQASCNCTSQEIESRLNQVGNNSKNDKTTNLEHILCCFPTKDFSILVREDYQAIEANDTILISSKPVKTSLESYVRYLNTAYSADTIRVINFKKTDDNQIMYLELQEINK